jgi:phosphoserine phosphatase RsbU/P
LEEKKRILLVDDNPSNIKILNNLLKDQYKISAATSGKDALKIAFSDSTPDVILLDIMMPDMDGYNVCERLKAEKRTHSIPVIFITTKSEIEDEARGFDLGAVDYITKPINPLIVKARIGAQIELLDQRQQLQRLNADLQHEKEINDIELELANNIQQQFLPDQSPDIKGFEIKSLFRPLHTIGGDFYDYYKINDDDHGIFLSDVAGHGISAALITSMLKILTTLMKKNKSNPGNFMTVLNNSLVDNTSQKFVTAIYGILSGQNGSFTFANAGHCLPLVYRKSSEDLNEIKLEGRALGVFGESKPFKTAIVQMQSGDMMFLFTDGVTESIEQDPEKGTAVLKETILASKEKSLETIIQVIFSNIESILDRLGSSFSDDITIIGVKKI